MCDSYHEVTGDHPMLEECSSGEWVSYAQQLLTDAGFPPQDHQIDGLFGPLTKEAVRDFQGTHGLTVDGIIGPQTWAALEGGGAAGSLQFMQRPTIDSSGWLHWTVTSSGGTVAAGTSGGSFEMYRDSSTVASDSIPLASDVQDGQESGLNVNLLQYTPDDGTYQVSVQVGNEIEYLDYVVENGQVKAP